MRSLLCACFLSWVSISLIASADEPAPAASSQVSTPVAAPAMATAASAGTTVTPVAASIQPTPISAPTPQAVVHVEPTCEDIKAFKVKVHAAIDAALKYPAELKFRPATGVTIVGYDYAEGQAHDAHITQWSGDGRLDRAALNAVKNADYASITPGIGTHKFHDSVIIVFDNSANTDKNTAEHEKKKDPASKTCG